MDMIAYYPLAPEVNKKKCFVKLICQYIRSVSMHTFKCMYLVNKISYKLDHATLHLVGNTLSSIPQL